MKILILPIIAAVCAAANAQEIQFSPSPTTVLATETSTSQPAELKAKLPAGTTVIVTLNDDLSTISNQLGDGFAVTVLQDVIQDGIVVIPKGTSGSGEVTFLTKKGSFGKPGILGIALRDLNLNGKKILLDGRYREEGGNNNAAAAATMFTVGIGAILVRGKSSTIPQGRELKARTGEEIDFTLSPQPTAQSSVIDAIDVNALVSPADSAPSTPAPGAS
jgi:hypothetical protein